MSRLGLLLLTACAPLPVPIAAMPDASGATVPLERLEEGRALMIAHCTGCHAPPQPRRKAPEEWPAVVADMAERADVTEREQAAIVTYLSVFSPL